MSFLDSAFDALSGKTAADQRRRTPEEEKAIRKADYNERQNGSRTVESTWNEYGQLEFHSSLTGNTYPSSDAARADEQAYLTNPKAWSAGRQGPTPMDDATGEQAAPEVGTQVADMGIDIAGTMSGARNAFDRPITNPALNPATAGPTPGTTSPRAGFTDLLGVTRPGQSSTIRQPTAPANPRITGATQIDPKGLPGPGGAPGTYDDGPGAEAPDIHRDQIDKILGGLTGYEGDFYTMSQDNTGLSEAEAQLQKAHLLATQRGRDALAANQAGAMGQARSARNRNDRGLLERQAIGEQAYLGSEAQRQQKNLDDQIPLDMAILKAKEDDADREFRFKALDKAASLGLNKAALEVDIAKADLESSTNWINNEFSQLGLDKQLNSEEAKSLLGFTRDMAAIQYEYDKLGTDDQNVADGLLMQKYGIDKDTMVKLKQIKEAGKFRWDQVLSSFVGGAATGATAGVSNLIGGSGGSGGVGFDNDVRTPFDPNA